jgi:hypothetical protein
VGENLCHIAILLKSLLGGGAEHVMLALAAEFAGRGHRVELVLGRMRGPLKKALPEGMAVRELEVCWLPRPLDRHLFASAACDGKQSEGA